MKQYLLSFIISLGTTAAVSCLNYFQSTPISCLGGLVLAAVTYWRLSAIGKVNNRILGNSDRIGVGMARYSCLHLHPQLQGCLRLVFHLNVFRAVCHLSVPLLSFQKENHFHLGGSGMACVRIFCCRRMGRLPEFLAKERHGEGHLAILV